MCCYLLHAMVDDALEVFNSWDLKSPEADKYTDIVKHFEAALGQTSINFKVERTQLHYMYQTHSETLDEFVTRCRSTQALTCNFRRKRV